MKTYDTSKMISEIDSIFIESFLYIVQPNAKVEWNTVVITLETRMLLNEGLPLNPHILFTD